MWAGNSGHAGKQECYSRWGIAFLQSDQFYSAFVSANLASSVNMRKGSGTVIVLERVYIYALISPRVRPDPLSLLGSGVTKDREEDSKTPWIVSGLPHV